MDEMKEKPHPLSDIWTNYSESLESAIKEGFIDDPDIAENFIWPGDLNLADFEQDDVKRYVHERMTEIVERVKKDNGVDPNIVAGYLFRSIVCSLMWEQERRGR